MVTSFGNSISDLIDTDVLSSSPLLVSILQSDGTYKSMKVTVANLHKKRQVSVATNHTISADEDTIISDSTSGSITITLPTAVGIAGVRKTIKKIVAANSIIVACNGVETIDGVTTNTLTSQWTKVTVESNGINWITV